MSLAYSVYCSTFLYWVLIMVSNGNEPPANEPCECLPNRTECCTDVFRHFIHDYGKKQYNIHSYRSWNMLATGRRTKSVRRIYLCERGGCRIFNHSEFFSEDKRTIDDEAGTTGEGRRKRGIVDSCCDV